jgi:hypothetical protein
MQQKVHAPWHWSLTETRDHPKEPINAAADFTWNPISRFACLQNDSRAILYGPAAYSSELARIFLYVGLE